MSDLCRRMADAMNMAQRALNTRRQENKDMGIPSVSPENMAYGAALEPPDDVERIVDLREAPFSAVLRAASEQCGDGAGDTSLALDLRIALGRWLRSIPVVEVELTAEEWAAYNEAQSE